LQDSNVNMKIVLWRSDSDHVCGMVPGNRANVLDKKITPEWMREHFGNNLPGWFLQPFCDQMNGGPANSFGAIRSVSQFHAPNLVLLGDAAHAVTSALGQGCNMALESVRVFGKLLDDSVASESTLEKALAKVPQQFTDVRERDARAMQHMELLHNLLQGTKAETKVDVFTAVNARVAWGSAFVLGIVQWKLMPNKYRTVPIYDMIYDENVPYSDVLAYVNRVGALAYGVLAATIAVSASNIWRVLTNVAP
jgi:flavin-dependent dehydrogenase